VAIDITMTSNPLWTVPWTQLARVGVKISTYPASTLTFTGTAMVLDGTTAFVGSQTFSTESLAHARELGVVTTDPAVVGPLSTALTDDFALASPVLSRNPGATTARAG